MILAVVFLSGILVSDHLLALEYAKIDLSDPYKNFTLIPVQSFKALKISGGNGYAIRIIKDDRYTIRLMNSRKDFFSMKMIRDTLSISFTVANQNYQQAQQSTFGLIISLPAIKYLEFSGTNNEVGPLLQDSLTVHQNINSVTRLKELQLNYLSLEGTATSSFDFQLKNTAKRLDINIANKAVVDFHQCSFNTFNPELKDSAAIIFYRWSLENLLNK